MSFRLFKIVNLPAASVFPQAPPQPVCTCSGSRTTIRIFVTHRGPSTNKNNPWLCKPPAQSVLRRASRLPFPLRPRLVTGTWLIQPGTVPSTHGVLIFEMVSNQILHADQCVSIFCSCVAPPPGTTRPAIPTEVVGLFAPG